MMTKNPRFSIILPCYLGDYPGAAKDRPAKLKRAIDSVIDQSVKDWELIVISDGCEETFDIVSRYDDSRVTCHMIPKQDIWSGMPRDVGKKVSTGELITYLDSDDYFGPDHLGIIDKEFTANAKSIYYNDWIWDAIQKRFIERRCNIRRIGENGTSNITFRRELDVRWDIPGYAHDYYFNQELVKLGAIQRAKPAQYMVCHLPGKAGYDI